MHWKCFGVLIMILFVISFVVIDRYDFSKIQELEE